MKNNHVFVQNKKAPLLLTQAKGNAMVQFSSSHSPALEKNLIETGLDSTIFYFPPKKIPPVDVCAIFSFVTVWTSSRPILICAQLVTIRPSDCGHRLHHECDHQHPDERKRKQITSKNPPAQHQWDRSTASPLRQSSARPMRCSAFQLYPGKMWIGECWWLFTSKSSSRSASLQT